MPAGRPAAAAVTTAPAAGHASPPAAAARSGRPRPGNRREREDAARPRARGRPRRRSPSRRRALSSGRARRDRPPPRAPVRRLRRDHRRDAEEQERPLAGRERCARGEGAGEHAEREVDAKVAVANRPLGEAGPRATRSCGGAYEGGGTSDVLRQDEVHVLRPLERGRVLARARCESVPRTSSSVE